MKVDAPTPEEREKAWRKEQQHWPWVGDWSAIEKVITIKEELRGCSPRDEYQHINLEERDLSKFPQKEKREQPRARAYKIQLSHVVVDTPYLPCKTGKITPLPDGKRPSPDASDAYSRLPPAGNNTFKHVLDADERKAATARILADCGNEPEHSLGKIEYFERCFDKWIELYESQWKITEQRPKLKEIDYQVDQAFKGLPGPTPKFLEAWHHLPDKKAVFVSSLPPAIRQELPQLTTKQVQDSLRRLLRAKLLRMDARSQQLEYLLICKSPDAPNFDGDLFYLPLFRLYKARADR